MIMDNEIDITKLKYVLYARKSSVDESRQVRSIPDQIADCLKLATDLGIRVVKILQESKSAKKPNQRPVFNEMIKDIKTGKYDAILAWNPDRLARNMLEGGMLIDMIDNNIIKDLKFKTHHFTKDANGKMLLGIAFVLSKQYSDNLSQVVTRGVDSSFFEGKSPAYKHGYYRDKNGYYRPDSKNFELVKEAWKMRKEGTSIEEIANYMNSEGYVRIIEREDKEPRLIDMDFRILSKLFKMPFYYGILEQAGKQIPLKDYYDFEPAVSEEDFFIVQELTKGRATPLTTRRNKAFYPLKGLLVCDFCGKNMVVAPSTSGNKINRYLSCRCDNPECTRTKRSCRMKYIFDFIDEFLKDGINVTEKEYNTYHQGISQVNEIERNKKDTQRRRLKAILERNRGEVTERSLKIVDYAKDSPVHTENTKRIDKLTAENKDLEQQIQTLNEQLANPDKEKLSLEQFLNLSKQIAIRVKRGDEVKKDAVCRLVFLNLKVNIDFVSSYQAKPPFDAFLKTRNIPLGRGPGN